MQYALFKVNKDTKVLIDALELQAIRDHGENIQEIEEDEDTLPLKIVYGAYRPSKTKSIDEAIEDLKASVNNWHTYVKGDQAYKIGLHDLIDLDPVQLNKTFYIPFTALISTNVDVNRNGQKSVTAFLRYEDMSIKDNIYKRHGILAINAQENRIKDRNVTHDNWVDYTEFERATKSSAKIF